MSAARSTIETAADGNAASLGGTGSVAASDRLADGLSCSKSRFVRATASPEFRAKEGPAGAGGGARRRTKAGPPGAAGSSWEEKEKSPTTLPGWLPHGRAAQWRLERWVGGSDGDGV